MAAKKFKGRDRRILAEFKRRTRGVDIRDAIALDTSKKTTRISTRVQIIPAMDTALVAAWALVKARIDTCLAMTV